MKTLRKISSILLVSLMLFSVLSLSAAAAHETHETYTITQPQSLYDFTIGTLIYDFETDSASDMRRSTHENSIKEFQITEKNTHFITVDGVIYTKDMKTLVRYPNAKPDTKFVVPDGVETIGEDALMYCSNIKELVLPESLKTIENNAFVGLELVEKITIPEGVTSFGEGVMVMCLSLKEVEFKNVMTEIPNTTFMYCYSLEKIEIAETVTSIGDVAFAMCSNLKTLNIPKSVTSIGKNVFMYTSLNEITVSSENEYYTVDSQGALYDKAMTNLIVMPNNGIEKLVIPETVKTLGEMALCNTSSIKEVFVPGDVENFEVSYVGCCGKIEYDEEKHEYIDTVSTYPVTIYGHKGSSAEKYVTEMNGQEIGEGVFAVLTFVDIETYVPEEPEQPEEKPEETPEETEKSFIDLIMDFFNSIIEFLKNLFNIG